ncbi:unnamed protein product [Acanthoscelides obtectus]|uniref:DDE Tnp4 domain-containing protein n=1 Tax=Acanthoscelides obtectus TaxID=200917 RepID=A0A9P0LS69_ACAOB|nr:unnamed protein product [Acanthoscelides obtectus]CAK1634038.1 hypothetical protein AOBTE_LOCUS8558 [Acanthoscelides obtectus]
MFEEPKAVEESEEFCMYVSAGDVAGVLQYDECDCGLMPKTAQEWETIANGFSVVWNFPKCVRVMDGKHIAIQAPKNSGSDFFNYKSFFSIVLFGVMDANYRFLYVHVGSQGRISDGGVVENTLFKKLLTRWKLNLPEYSALPGREKLVPNRAARTSSFYAIEPLIFAARLDGAVTRPRQNGQFSILIFMSRYAFSERHEIVGLNARAMPTVGRANLSLFKICGSIGSSKTSSLVVAAILHSFHPAGRCFTARALILSRMMLSLVDSACLSNKSRSVVTATGDTICKVKASY